MNDQTTPDTTDSKRTTTEIGDFIDRFEDSDNRYRQFEGEDLEVDIGDMVFFDDPDAGRHADECPQVQSFEVIGYVDSIKMMRDSFDDTVEIHIGMAGSPVGWLDPTADDTLVIPTQGAVGLRAEPITDGIPNAPANMAQDLYESDEYDTYRAVAHHGGRRSIPDQMLDGDQGNICDECWNNEDGPTHEMGS